MPYDKSIIIFITTFKSIHVICNWLWEKGQFQAFLKIKLLAPQGRVGSCTTHFVIKVMRYGVMAVSVHPFLFTERSKSLRKH